MRRAPTPAEPDEFRFFPVIGSPDQVVSPIAVRPHPLASRADAVLPGAFGLGYIVRMEVRAPATSSKVMQADQEWLSRNRSGGQRITNPNSAGDALHLTDLNFGFSVWQELLWRNKAQFIC